MPGGRESGGPGLFREAQVSVTILFVDDNEAARYAGARLLRHAGFVVYEAATGREALALLQVLPDVVLLDVRLPDIDGLEVCRRIRGRTAGADALVMLMTARALGDGDRVLGLDAGADAYLAMPLDPEVLVATIRALVRTRQSARSRALAGLGADMLSAPTSFEEAIDMLEDARRAVRARDELLAVVAHDLTNPLSTVHLTAGVLLRRVSRAASLEESRSLLEAILRTTERSHRLVRDIVDMAALEAGRLPIEAAPCIASELLAEAADENEKVVSSSDQVLRTEIGGSADVVVECDRYRVRQVFANLIANAARYGAPGGQVVLAAQSTEDEACFSVIDDGPGIPNEDLPRVFERFFKGRNAAGRGAGLGLAISKGIVEAQGGRIWAESALGRGTTVSFTLPRAMA